MVFATDDTAMLACCRARTHYWWAVSASLDNEGRLRYTPSDVFETFPLPELTQRCATLGDRLDTYRRDVMLARQTGLTKTYNLVFDRHRHGRRTSPNFGASTRPSTATSRAYGWDDLLEGSTTASTPPAATSGTPSALRPAGDPRPAAGAQPRALCRGGGQGSARQEEGAHRPGAEEVRRRGPVLMPPSSRRCEICSGKMRQRFSSWSSLRVDPRRRDELRQPVADPADPLRDGICRWCDPAQHRPGWPASSRRRTPTARCGGTSTRRPGGRTRDGRIRDPGRPQHGAARPERSGSRGPRPAADPRRSARSAPPWRRSTASAATPATGSRRSRGRRRGPGSPGPRAGSAR